MQRGGREQQNRVCAVARRGAGVSVILAGGGKVVHTRHFVTEEPDLQRYGLQVAQLIFIFRGWAAGDRQALGADPGCCVCLTRVQRRVSCGRTASAQTPRSRTARTCQAAYSALIRRAHTAVSTTSAMRRRALASARRPAALARGSQQPARRPEPRHALASRRSGKEAERERSALWTGQLLSSGKRVLAAKAKGAKLRSSPRAPYPARRGGPLRSRELGHP